MRGYPALVDEGDSASVRSLASEVEAARATGCSRLLALDLPSPAAGALRGLSDRERLSLASAPHRGGTNALLADALDAAISELVGARSPDVRDPAAYEAIRAEIRAVLPGRYGALLSDIAAVLALAQDVRRSVREEGSPALLATLTDVREQLAELLPDGFVSAAGAARMPDLMRYLRAIQVRLERAPERLRADQAATWQVRELEAEHAAALRRLDGTRRHSEQAAAVQRMLQELRVSLFAPTIRTPYSVSDKRIRRALADLEHGAE